MVVKKSEGSLNKEEYVKYIADVSNTYPEQTREVHQKVGELFRELKGNYPTVVLAAEFDIAARLLANDFVNEAGALGGQAFAERVLAEVRKKNMEMVERIHNSR